MGTFIGSIPLGAFPHLAFGEGSPPELYSANSQFAYLKAGKRLQSLTLRRLDGEIERIATGGNKVFLINFWATWCAACLSELPSLNRLQASMGSDRFEAIAISVDEAADAPISSYVNDLHIKYLPIYHDKDGSVARWPGAGGSSLFTLYGVPVTYLVDGAGKILGSISGPTDWDRIEARNFLRYFIEQH